MKQNINKNVKNKFKKVVTTGVAASILLTAGGLAVKHHNDNKKESSGKEYTIQSGDTLYDIADKYYGNGMYYEDIANANGINNPDQIREGDVIILPEEVNDVELNENPVMTYTVVSGDTMIGICEKYYNDNSYETALRLAKYNGLSDAGNIRVGQELTIPTYEVVLSVNPYPYDYEYDSLARK